MRCIALFIGMIAAASATCHASDAAQTGGKPNILWLTSEDHGPHMGCYGDKIARAPHVKPYPTNYDLRGGARKRGKG